MLAWCAYFPLVILAPLHLGGSDALVLLYRGVHVSCANFAVLSSLGMKRQRVRDGGWRGCEKHVSHHDQRKIAYARAQLGEQFKGEQDSLLNRHVAQVRFQCGAPLVLRVCVV